MSPMREEGNHNNTSRTHNADNHRKMAEEGSQESKECGKAPAKKTSMGSLISWNISKALENNPNIDLKAAMKLAQDRLEESSSDVNSMLSRYTHERHLACALLAWQNLGHRDADSLYSFVTSNLSETNSTQKACKRRSDVRDCPTFLYGKGLSDAMAGSNDVCLPEYEAPVGPVVRLPVESIVMPVHQCNYDNKPPVRQQLRKNAKDMKSKIDAACCMNNKCADRLSEMDMAVSELRERACRLAKREAQRVELLERAEQAWRDLESGYQRRLRTAEEKEHEIAKQNAKLMLQRNEEKTQTTALIAVLKTRTDAAENDREALAAVEQEMCIRACERAKLAEQAAKSDAALAEHLCKAAQLDRELMFKEEQSRRKQQSMEGAADSALALLHAAERAMREELSALRDQISRVGEECNQEDATIAQLRGQLDELRDERNGLAEDLQDCQLLCDNNMKDQQDELVNKRQQLAEVHKNVMECRCKFPVDAMVTVKRTPSLAALCRCSPEDQFGDSCSCTSLRSQLLSNLLADLFGGLQSELGDTGAQMPCQLLKCLEDKHNWDRSTQVKTNLRDYFSKLLLGELDIAIATSIEKYHATWVGASCADKPLRADMPCESMHSADWQSRALECKAQKMATKLAEQLYKEKAKQLAQEAQEYLAKQGRPPCECHPSSCLPSPPVIPHTQCHCPSSGASRGAAVYQCLVKPPMMGGKDSTNNELTPPKYLRRTLQDVSQLRDQIEDLKKNIIKREDLTTMEANIVKMVQFASVISPVPSLLEIREPAGIMKKDPRCPRPCKTDALTKNSGVTKLTNRKKSLEPTTNTNKPLKQSFNQFRTKASGKDFKRPTQQFSVNLCLCDAKTKVSPQKKFSQSKSGSESICKRSVSKDTDSHSTNKCEPQIMKSVTPEISYYDKTSTLSSCPEKCICFHKKPSDISINKLLETLTKWRDDLVHSSEEQNIDKRPENLKSIFQISQQIVSNIEEKPCNKILDDKSIGNLELFKVSSQNVKALCNSETLTDTIEQVETSARLKMEVDLPTLTDSEYMGAINLEKSTEHSCECEKNQNDGPMCYKNADNFPFKCIKSKKCMCKSCFSTPMHQEHEIETESVLTHNSSPVKSRIMQDCNFFLDPETLHKKTQNKEVNDIAVSAKTSLKSAKCSALFQNNIENCIKCLGVTLSNVTSQTLLHNPDVKQLKMANIGISNSAFQKSNVDKKNNTHCEFLLKKNCFCIDKFKEAKKLKNYVESVFEPCVCCPNFDVNGSTDLEVNAFQLLEEYLRGKLADFKHSVCKSSCIPHCDAEQLFTDILQRVKQLIFDTTSTVSCECEGNSQVKGSWKRAYSLLYEYLRTKIERVKCQCQSKNETKDDVVLPNILNDISYLIENDFKRLQEICKCKKNKLGNKPELNTNEKTKDTSDIVIDDCNIKEVSNIVELKCTSTLNICGNGKSPELDITEPHDPSSLIHSVSAQMSPYHCMEMKSCDAMDKTNIMYPEMPTIEENIKIVTIDGFNNTKSASDCCDKTKIASKGSNFVEVIEKNDNPLDEQNVFQKEPVLFPASNPLNVNNKESVIQMEIERIFGEKQEMDKVNKKARNASLTYIGYTMNCCCDTALGCVCTKSTVRAQNDRLKIKDIWKSYMNNNTVCHNVSYMLDNAPDKLSKTVNYVEFRDGFYPKLGHEYDSIHRAKSNVCESEINTNSQKDITLKESKQSVNMSHVTTNTKERMRKPKSDSSLDCSDCFTAPNRSRSERFSVMKQNKKCELFYPEKSFIQFDDSDAALIANTANTSDFSMLNCDCKMVPICHVKMLVENIETKLANAQCTCDALSSKVCPVHSQREIY